MKCPAALATCVAAVLSLPPPASAVTEQHVLSGGPAARCQAALPVFDGTIRKRPLALSNEGAKSAFITCSFPFDVGQVIPGSVEVDVVVSNATAAPVILGCVAVSGADGLSGTLAAEFAPQIVTIAARSQSEVYWGEVGFRHGLSASGLISISCALPPGVSLNDSYVGWMEDDRGT